MARLKNALLTLTALLMLIIGLLYCLFKPSHLSLLTHRGQPIPITRDAHNIPHIEAPNWQALMYAWGHVVAEDRLFQISFKQLLIEGKLSQYLGERTLNMDRFMRELDLYGWSLKMQTRLKHENPQEFDNLQAYADGINDCVARMSILPLEFHLLGLKWENWTIAKSYAVYKLVEWTQSSNIGEEFFKSTLLENYTKEEVEHFLPNVDQLWAFPSQTTVRDEDIPASLKFNHTLDGGKTEFDAVKIEGVMELGLMSYLNSLDGSNSWTIAGAHTASGRPILSNDPHLESTVPCQWYQTRATYPTPNSTQHYSGVSIAGLPLAFGQTKYLASTTTAIQYDNQDLYKETVEGDRYLVDGQWRDLKVREEKIYVKGEAGVREEVYTVRETHRGPIIHYIFSAMGNFKLKDGLSLSWTGFNDQISSVTAFTHWPDISSLPALQSFALNQTKHFFNLNIQFITADDHLLYQQLGIYPLRRAQSSGHFVKDGSTSHHDWVGLMPHHHRLQITDPPSGFQFTANNRIASPSYYGGYLQYTLYTARANRIHQLLTTEIQSGRKITIDFVKNMLTDNLDIYCVNILPEIRGVLPEAEGMLGSFDCRFEAESHQATIYEVFFYELHNQIKPHKTGNFSILSLYTYQQFIYNHIHAVYQGKTHPIAMRTAWSNMLTHLAREYSSDQPTSWRWGDYHRDVMMHSPFGRSPLAFIFNLAFPGRGNLNTLNLGKMNQQELGNFNVNFRPNYRFVHSFEEGSWWIIDSGSSENILSPHYSDQWQLFRNNQWLPIVNGPALPQEL